MDTFLVMSTEWLRTDSIVNVTVTMYLLRKVLLIRQVGVEVVSIPK